MKIYTGYFAKLKSYLDNNLEPIAVCQYLPSYYHGKNYHILAPNKSILFRYKNKEIDKNEYTKLYKKQLKKLDIDKVYDDLLALSDNKDVILLCYDKIGDFCHRHIIAKWFNHFRQLNVREYEVKVKGLLS